MFRFKIAASLITLFLTACGDEQVFSEQYYRDNPQAKAEKIAYCNENPDEKLISLNCINALSVSSQEKIEAQRGKGLNVNLAKAELPPTTVPKRTKQYYLDNAGERDKQVAICNKLEGAKKWTTPNCGTALEADAYLKALNSK
ncbi:MAG: EexN family lipoprotein [Pseudoalteromonas prydzensis]|uniref:EexN family lipoprotein n=1 Tax=Pseudoalteromonas prydzensis TaxID=182141 RepID=UPI003F9C2DE5